ncbi:hypothetical protein WG66_003178 [Moniliophthora roreri]|nr:hypothetical protein WG66_003178 [Moniliophthora roreri]
MSACQEFFEFCVGTQEPNGPTQLELKDRWNIEEAFDDDLLPADLQACDWIWVWKTGSILYRFRCRRYWKTMNHEDIELKMDVILNSEQNTVAEANYIPERLTKI